MSPTYLTREEEHAIQAKIERHGPTTAELRAYIDGDEEVLFTRWLPGPLSMTGNGRRRHLLLETRRRGERTWSAEACVVIIDGDYKVTPSPVVPIRWDETEYRIRIVTRQTMLVRLGARPGYHRNIAIIDGITGRRHYMDGQAFIGLLPRPGANEYL